jgi:hypothetical protein
MIPLLRTFAMFLVLLDCWTVLPFLCLDDRTWTCLFITCVLGRRMGRDFTLGCAIVASHFFSFRFLFVLF